MQHFFLIRLLMWKSVLVTTDLAYACSCTLPYPPPPPKVNGGKVTSAQTWHLSFSATSLFCKKMYNDFLLVTSLAESFVNSDWLELVIYFQTKKPNGKQNSFMVNFSDNSDLQQGFKASLSDFWDRVISLRTAESHRYVFGRYRCLHFVTNWLWKIFNISRNASDRSPLFSRRNWYHIYCASR